ncbi:protein GRAVITROPIC IN THE LIGHT 1-like [Olea europaea var. sylvestris]|uniref:DUF641 domain-containing protein n=1 Tax=Olea europaea subsp. europaea TaxID=158383 RepID=A0A8S0VC81_OLEEU|nr:protein GRAVITROPIC IN THE LIGHT 1-like [Olea europaea var. sylvestris]CAA3029347.1 Hypothetical predicted protein [Olea europaea subsp. europaea]
MDSVKQSSATPSKIRLARTFAKVLHIRALTGIAPDDGVRKIEMKLNDHLKSPFSDDEDEFVRDRAVEEAFLAKLFAGISAVKAAYAELQFAQCPYDADGIQSADQMLVLELKNLSELKQCYLKKQLDMKSPEKTLVLAEIQEQKSLLQTYEIMSKKLDSQLKLKDSEITFLEEKLADVDTDNNLLQKRLKSSGHLGMPEDIHFSGLSLNHFVTCFKQTVNSVRGFVRLLINEMESAGWDLEAAARSIEPGLVFWKQNHKCFAFESFVCKEIFDGFSYPNFSIQEESLPEQKERRRLFFDRFMELKSVRPADYLAWKPKSAFAMFCRAKYLRLIHPKMEASLFDNLDQRNLVNSGDCLETPFFLAFAEMAKRIWLLHCLALSFDREVSIFQVTRGARFSEVYMDSLSDEAFLLSDGTPETDPHVAFTVVPGFRIGKTVVQCQVYLINPACT